ncbi:MAG: DUF2235 domain-containing protein [Burkholderiales bacterium]|nr:DUF2235 domain-containing protein [Burkholderiales bacterium]
MPSVVEISEQQRRDILEANLAQAAACAEAAQRRALAKGSFVFFAAFDGTNNDKDDLAGDAHCSNVGQLWQQYDADRMENLQGGYYPGLGTNGRPTRETWMSSAVTVGVIETAKKAYIDYAKAASAWLAEHPRAAVSVVLAGFSRGTASAAIFSQLLYKRGLVLPYPSGKVLIEPGATRIASGVLFDPVATGVKGNLAFPPNTRNLVVFKALNEYRHLFKAVNYTRQPDIAATLGFYGNHCDVGGGYDNGLAAVTLDAATRFLQKSGLAIDDVPAARGLVEGELAVHSEERDNHGQKIWDGYHPDGFSFRDHRLFDRDVQVSPASRPNAAGQRGFTLYDGPRLML